MSFIEGQSLDKIAKIPSFYFWKDGLLMGINICRHLEFSHNLPQGVLHRDVRPSNVMAPNYQWDELEAADLNIDRHETVLLNYDMSWHVNAKGQSLSGNIVESGFYAPELIEESSDIVARTTTVDSYGIGMTLFYLYTKQAPPTAGSKSTDWETTLENKFRANKELIWKSAADRLRRIVYDSTRPLEEERISVARIRARLEMLFMAIMGKHDKLTADIWAEELMFRSTSENYVVNESETEFRKVIKQGREIVFRGDIRKNIVELKFINTGTESTDRTRAVKLWGDKLKSCRQILESGGWIIGDGTSYRNMQIVLNASISTAEIHQDISKISKVVNRGLDQIRLD
jgi:serine/threonine protein kinase